MKEIRASFLKFFAHPIFNFLTAETGLVLVIPLSDFPGDFKIILQLQETGLQPADNFCIWIFGVVKNQLLTAWGSILINQIKSTLYNNRER